MSETTCTLPQGGTEPKAAGGAAGPYALELENVSLSFDQEPVLRDFTLRVARGETRVILGRSGAGKSTILKLALGLLRPDSGRVKVFGVDITKKKERDLSDIRHRIGMVFQGGALFDSLSVAENVGFCLLERHHVPMEQAAPIIRERLHYVGLENAFSLMPSELSGGMANRVVTHILRDARAVADTVTMIQDGRTLFEGTPSQITASTDPDVLDFISERGL
jgi:phospholipid/cholesterol/gamma-HCH transport system ATP-binding protein